MNFKKILCVLLAIVAVVAMASCKKDGKNNDNKDWTMAGTDLSYLDYIGIEDMEGYNFRIYCRPGSGMITDQYIEEETGDIINDAVYRRNETVKSLFNIEITASESSENKAIDAVNTILAGDDQFDVIFPHSRYAFQYAVQNTLVNLNDVKTIHTDKEWWSKDLVDAANINGYLYVLDGDIQTHRLEYGYTMYFNKRIFDELGLDYPYQMALDGEWTFDEFAKLVKMGSKDLNGDGLMTKDQDQFGYRTYATFGPIEVLYSGGQRIYSKNARGIPTLTLNTPKTVEIFSKFFNLCSSEDVVLGDNRGSYSGEIFTEGRCMFADDGLGSAKKMRSMNDDFGVLPWPKFTKDDKYNTMINGHASLLVMPITVSDYDRTGKIIEALCAVGNKEVIPAFYDVSLKTKFSRDYESEAMIDIVKESLIYDLGYISGNAVQGIGEGLAHQSNPDFASYYARNESKALSDLSTFLASYAKIG
ncbi:MAG: extracellular solute-binding protein [Clostridia bacterium]|nr:extracellular solute-binding protein [Clostridia bacterium]